MEDCKHVEYDMDGPHCKIGKSKGFQCRYRFGEDCGYYEPKMTDKEQIKEMASDMDYACTKRDLYPDDAREIAKVLLKLGYHKTIWHKKADKDFPPTNKKVLFKLAEYDELTVGFLREDGLFDLETYSGFYGTDADIIAWTELPTYKE